MNVTPRAHNGWIILLGLILMFVLTAIIYLEFHQRSLLSNTLRYEEDNISWNFFQLDRNLLQLQNILRKSLDEPEAVDQDELQIRIDIFENQSEVIESGTAVQSLAHYYDSVAALQELAGFRQKFRSYLDENGASRLDADAKRRMLRHIEQLQLSLHDLSLAGNQMFMARSEQQTDEVKRQITISTTLVMFQFLLVLGFSYIVLRQVRQLDKRAALLGDALSHADRSYAELSSYMQAIDQHALVMAADSAWRITYVNDSFCKISGYEREELLGQDASMLEAGLYPERFFEIVRNTLARGETWRGEVCGKSKDGSFFWVDTAFVPIRDAKGQIVRYLSVRIDITEKKQADEHISYRATHDDLTGLPNLILLEDRAQQALAYRRNNREQAAILFIDLDNFKPVNDRVGHANADLLLKEVAERLESSLRQHDTVARQGGDEFIVLLPAVSSAQEAESIAQRILTILNEPYRINGQELSISASIGIALYPDDGEDTATLLRNSDIAMYHAKANGRNQSKFFGQKAG